VPRAVLLTSALVALSAGLIAFTGWRTVGGLDESLVKGRLQQGERAFDYIVGETGAELEGWAGSLAASPAIRAQAAGQGGRDAEEVILPLLRTWNVDFIAVIDAWGQVHTVPPELQSLPSLSSAAREWGETAGGSRRSGIRRETDGSLTWLTIAPIGNAARPSGFVVAGFLIGKGFADRFKATTGLDGIIIAGNRVVGSSLATGAFEAKLTESLAAAPDVHGGGKGLPSAVEAEGRSHQIVYFPLVDTTGQPIAMFGASTTKVLGVEQQGSLMNNLLLFALEMGALAAGCTWLVARGVVRPFRTISQAVERMAEGDLSTPLEVSPGDEMGGLARQLEDMRERLRSAVHGLAIEKSRYRGIFDSMSEAVFTTDLEGTITSANAAALSIFACPLPEGESFDCYGQFGLEDPDGRPVCDGVCLRKDGCLTAHTTKARVAGARGIDLDLDVTTAPVLDDAGRTVGVVHVARDISALEELQRMKNQFLLSVAHELRTPLSSLLASVDVLRQDAATMTEADQERMFNMVRRGTLRLQNLISNLLDLGSIEAGRFAVNRQSMDLRACLEEAVAMCEPLLAPKGQRIVLRHAADLPLVHGDSRRLSQVLMNLLTNCGKYGPENDAIEIEVWPSPQELCVAVSDHGPAIPKEDAEHLFEYFYQAKNTPGMEAKGFGLGLAIVKGIIDAHDGKMGVESGLERGNTIWFTLPIAARPLLLKR